jgi:DNA-binding GntR family transcriptional regulator
MVEAVYNSLRRRVVSGELPPGSALRQEDLARHYGASRVPVREAMTRLEAEGLLLLRPRRGYVVGSLDLSEIEEIFALRAVVEEHAGRLAAEAHTPDDLVLIERALKRMDGFRNLKPCNYEAWLDSNAAFHAALVYSAHRRHVAATALKLRDLVEPYIRVEINLTQGVEGAQAEHRLMFEALKASDAERLGELCRQHCNHTAERLVKGLRTKRA